MTSWKRKFLLAAAGVPLALGGFAEQAWAANLEIIQDDAANAVGALLNPAADGGDIILNSADDNAGADDFGAVNANDGEAVHSIDLNEAGGNATLIIYDSVVAADALESLTAGFVDVHSGRTLTFIMGGTTGATSGKAGLVVTTTLGDAGGTDTLVKGGTVNFNGAANVVGTSTVSVGGNTMLTALNVNAGAGGAAAVGQSVTATFGAAGADTDLNVDTMLVTGGNAHDAAARAGGAAKVDVNSAATVGTTAGAGNNLRVTAGNAEDAAGAAGGNAEVNFKKGLTILGAGDLLIDGGNAAAGADSVGGAASVNVTGDLTMGETGDIKITGGNDAAQAGGNASLKVTGNTTARNLELVTGSGGGAGNEGGATATFSGNLTAVAITMDDNDVAVGGDPTVPKLVFNGTEEQTVTGTINGVDAIEGEIEVDNAEGAIFTGVIGGNQEIASITIDDGAAAAGSSTATFQANVTAAQITLGGVGGAGDVNTVIFSATSGNTNTITALISGTANEDNRVVVSGGGIVTLASAAGAGGELDKVTVSGDGTTLDSNAAITAAITIESGNTLDQGAGLITGNIANSGILKQTGAGGITGNITGDGALDINAAATYTGSIQAATADIGAFTWSHDANAAAGNYNVGTTTFSGAGTLAFDNAARTITGNFVTTADAQGTITIEDGAITTAIKGDLGAEGRNLAALTLAAGAGANTVTTTGNLYVNTITLDEDDTLQFLGASAQVVSGTIVAETANDGTINVGNGNTATDVTFRGLLGGGPGAAGAAAIDPGALHVFAGAKATFAGSGTHELDGAIDNDGEIVINSTDVLTGLSYDDTADGAALTIGIKRDAAATAGKLEITNAAIDLVDSTVNFVIEAGSKPLKAGTIADVFKGTAVARLPGDAGKISDNSYLYKVTLVANANNVNNLDAKIETENAIANTVQSGFAGVANALMSGSLIDEDNAQINALQTLIQTQSTAKGVADVVEATTSPNLDRGAVIGGLNVVNSVSDITSRRLASLRSGATGVATGDAASRGVRAWGQVFGTTGKQDARKGVSGYDVDTYGAAFGVDTELAGNSVLGLGFSYAKTDVKSKGLAKAKTDIDSYQFSLYGDHNWDNRAYLSGQFGYIWSNNETTRNPGGLAAQKAKGKFDAKQIMARVEAGRAFSAGRSGTLTPSVLLNYNNYDADKYTETGAGGANLAVNQKSLNILEIGLGLDASWTHRQARGSYLKPGIHAGIRYDMLGEKIASTNTFTGGGTAFTSKGAAPARATFNAGADVQYFTTDSWELSASYDFEYKSEYKAHSGYLKTAYKF